MGKNPKFVSSSGSLVMGVRFHSGSEYLKNTIHIQFEFCKCRVWVWFGSVLKKTWVLVRFVLAGFGLFPMQIGSVKQKLNVYDKSFCLVKGYGHQRADERHGKPPPR